MVVVYVESARPPWVTRTADRTLTVLLFKKLIELGNAESILSEQGRITNGSGTAVGIG